MADYKKQYEDLHRLANGKQTSDGNFDIYRQIRFAADAIEELLAENERLRKAASAVYGRWEHLGGDEWRCTACGNVIFTEGSWEKPSKKFCGECGAKMDGNED